MRFAPPAFLPTFLRPPSLLTVFRRLVFRLFGEAVLRRLVLRLLRATRRVDHIDPPPPPPPPPPPKPPPPPPLMILASAPTFPSRIVSSFSCPDSPPAKPPTIAPTPPNTPPAMASLRLCSVTKFLARVVKVGLNPGRYAGSRRSLSLTALYAFLNLVISGVGPRMPPGTSSKCT